MAENKAPLDYVVYAKAHDPHTLMDLCLGRKPRIYISFSITKASKNELNQVTEIRNKLSEYFTCLDPYAIKDWEIITAHDDALQGNLSQVDIPSAAVTLEIGEVEEAIDELRSQTVERDYSLVASSHATVVVHVTEYPSYGVMAEIIYSRSVADNPVYVLYPFKKRPSPFFEFYASRDHIIQDENLESCAKALITKMLDDVKSEKWPKAPKQ
jgi:adenylate kinase